MCSFPPVHSKEEYEAVRSSRSLAYCTVGTGFFIIGLIFSFVVFGVCFGEEVCSPLLSLCPVILWSCSIIYYGSCIVDLACLHPEGGFQEEN